MKRFGWLLLFGAVAISSLSTSAQAQSSPDADAADLVDLKTLTCRELLKSEGENRRDLVLFIHAFISGKTGDTVINGPVLAGATNKIIDACIDNPDRKLLSVFEKYR